MRISLLAVLFLAGFQLYGQRLENIRAESVNGGEKVTITYDINGGSPGQKFKVSVYGSHNNYGSALTLISGDVNDVTPGTNKKIEWNAKNEISEYNGDITFELRADPILTPFSVKTPGSVKKGKSTDISWSGGTPGENVKLELIKNGVVVQQIGNTTNNTDKFSWAVPPDVGNGSDYQVRLTATSGVATSGQFGIKSAGKVKPWMIIAPAAVVVGVVVFLVVKGGKNKGPNDLPEPPTNPE